MKVEIYAKQNCPYCIKAKHAFKKRGHEYTEYEVGKDCTKEDIQNRVDVLGISIQIKTVPQIFVDDKYIGGYDDLVRTYDWH